MQTLREDHAPFGDGPREDTNVCIVDSLSDPAMLMITPVGWYQQERRGPPLVSMVKSYLTPPGALPCTQELGETAWWSFVFCLLGLRN